MSIYFYYFIQFFKENVRHKFKLFVVSLSQTIAPIVTMLVLTSFISIPGVLVSGSSLVSYFIVTSFLYVVMYTKVDDYVAKKCINDGALAVFLTKPLEFWLVVLMNDLAFRVIKIAVALPVILFLMVIYKDTFAFTITGSPLLVVIAFMLTFWLSFLIALSVGFLAFFIEEVWGFQHLKEVTLILLSGVVLPYDFFPDLLQRVLVFTPFPYLVNWPFRIGFSGSYVIEFLCAGVWLIVFAVLVRVMWLKGMRRYSGMGAY